MLSSTHKFCHFMTHKSCIVSNNTVAITQQTKILLIFKYSQPIQKSDNVLGGMAALNAFNTANTSINSWVIAPATGDR